MVNAKEVRSAFNPMGPVLVELFQARFGKSFSFALTLYVFNHHCRVTAVLCEDWVSEPSKLAGNITD